MWIFFIEIIIEMFVIFKDQNLLLEESWAELFVIMSAQYGLPIESKNSISIYLYHYRTNSTFFKSFCLNWILMALDLVIPSNEAAIHKLYKAIHQILLLRLSHTEIACLKTLILFRPGKWRVVLFIIIKTCNVDGRSLYAH